MSAIQNFTHKRGDTFKGKEFQISQSVGVSTRTAFPVVGVAGVIYKAIDTGLHYEWLLTVYVLTEDRNYMDLTGCELLCQLRVTPLTPVAYTIAMTITDAATGKIRMDAQIIDVIGKAYVYDIQIVFPNGVTETYISGTFTIVDDVSRLT